MATITISINDEVERNFRSKVYQLYGKRKGSIGKAVSEAMQHWAAKKEYMDTCMHLLEKGANLGKLAYKEREELHERH